MTRHSHHLGRILAVALAIGAAALLVACDAPQTTFSPKSDVAQRVHTLYILVTIMASLVGAVVIGALLYALFRFRSRGRGLAPAASQTHGNTRLEIAWTIAPFFVLILIGVPTIFAIARGASDPQPNALEVRVTAHQWWWEIEYPGLGADDPDNPGGRLALVTANEIHLPVGVQASIAVESEDVVHSFWVPQLVGKVDAIPGRVALLPPFTPQESGVFYGQCAEFCGLAHAQMRFRVVVESLAEFNTWVEALQTPADPPSGLAAQGHQLFMAKGCAFCHTIAGTSTGTKGPDLTRFGSRLTLGAGIMENNDENLRRWILDLRQFKPVEEEHSANPGTATFMLSFAKMPADSPFYVTENEAEAIANYLRSMRVE